MPAPKYRVMLLDDERATPEALLTKDKCAASCGYETIRQLLKKHPQTPAARGMVHSGGERRVCGGAGGRAGPG
jgi:hypothetical protein